MCVYQPYPLYPLPLDKGKGNWFLREAKPLLDSPLVFYPLNKRKVFKEVTPLKKRSLINERMKGLRPSLKSLPPLLERRGGQRG